MKKQIPNLLSLSRIVLSPLVIYFYFSNDRLSSILALVLLIILEITDALDGYTARRFNVVSNVGKILDPFADTLLHLTLFTIFLAEGTMPLWMYLISLYRDMLSMFIRIYSSLNKGVVVAARFSGKLKTFSRALAVIVIFLAKIFKYTININYNSVVYYSLLVVTIITIYSFFDYISIFTKKGKE